MEWKRCKYLAAMNTIKSVAVCGAGTMGSGIAQVAAMAGYTTIQMDVHEPTLAKSKELIHKNLRFLVNKGKLTQAEMDAYINRIHFTTETSACKADLIIEAIIEKEEAKINLFQLLAGINSETTLFATNTSSISISRIAHHIPHPERVIGIHFFNPAPLMKLVEVVSGKQSNSVSIDRAVSWVKAVGKTPIVCKDAPGFVVNRVARHYYLESMKAMQEHKMLPEEVDRLMESSGFKMGPCKLMDLIGIDINFGVSQIVWNDLGKPIRLTPSTLQQAKVEAGELGRKTGKGFYSYQQD